jgi:Putative secretion activating protein
MAKVELFAPHVLNLEGGFVDNKNDRGGATKFGVTLQTWRSMGYDKDGDGDIDVMDLKAITKEDAIGILSKHYWARWRADQIRNQSVANLLVDWTYNSGAWGIKIPQRLMSLTVDGVVGPKTIATVNDANQKILHQRLIEARLQFVHDIVKNNPSQNEFLKGWENRIKSFKYQG